MHALRVGALAVIASVVAVGCASDHVMGPGGPGRSPYPEPINPYSVLDALAIAYENKDTLEIKALYHDQYDGSSVDQTDPSPTTLVFSKANEVAHVSALAHSSTIRSIHLTGAPNRIRFHDAGDPAGWATIQNPFSGIEISDVSATHTVVMTHNTMQFKFIPTAPSPSSPTDTTWKIIHWTEVRTP